MRQYKVGDKIKYTNLTGNYIGIIRYIGILDNYGDKNYIWSEWDKHFDGRILPSTKGGTLRCADPTKGIITIINNVKKEIKEYGIVRFCKSINK